jgi:hypothetical protein
LERRLSVLHVLVLACAAVLCLAGVRFVLVQGGTSRAQDDALRQEIRLRSFAAGATGRLSVRPGVGGMIVQLTALRLPPPQALDARARKYVVWAVAGGGGRIVNLGTIERDELGNGGLAFSSPPALERYSVIVTAESNAQATNPLGPPILTTRAGEVIAQVIVSVPNRIDTRAVLTGTTRASVGAKGARRADFYAEVEDALDVVQTRTLTLIGDEVAPGARGTARLLTNMGKTFVRARIRRLPLPSAVGAHLYVLWAHAADGRVAYLGSLPANINETEIYVYAELSFNAFDLFVTAENSHPALLPSNRRALRTTAMYSPIRLRHRFWRRHRRRRKPQTAH